MPVPQLHRNNMLARVARKATAPYLRRAPWCEKDELVSEAWSAMLDALPRFDGKRDLEGFLFGAAIRAVHRFAWRQGSALHVTTRNAGELPGDVRSTQRAAVDADSPAALRASGHAPDPEEALAQRELRAAIGERLARLMAHGEEPLLALELLMGERPAAEVARERGLPVRAVQSVGTRAREALRNDARLLVLYQQATQR